MEYVHCENVESQYLQFCYKHILNNTGLFSNIFFPKRMHFSVNYPSKSIHLGMGLLEN